MKKLKGLFDIEKEYLKTYEKKAQQVLDLEDKYSKLKKADFPKETEKLKKKLKKGTLDDIAIEAFALVRAASKKSLKMTPFKVQVMGAFALLDKNIAEMKTGEGKTLMATMAAYTLALNGKGVHIVTVNDYLAKRDAKEMGVLYSYLGLSTGFTCREHTKEEKRENYAMDITYVTNNEIGFDYLRD
ncbi:MAG: preprotein translocase subunit SecA, partial [Mycoplasmatales bacterium]